MLIFLVFSFSGWEISVDMYTDVVVTKMRNSVHILSSANFCGFMVFLLVSFVTFKLNCDTLILMYCTSWDSGVFVFPPQYFPIIVRTSPLSLKTSPEMAWHGGGEGCNNSGQPCVERRKGDGTLILW